MTLEYVAKKKRIPLEGNNEISELEAKLKTLAHAKSIIDHFMKI